VPDWLIAADDLLTHRLRTCTCCSRAVAVGEGWLQVMEIGPLSVAVLRCRACYTQAGALARLDRLLRQRYDAAATSGVGRTSPDIE
jgi:hypothetical protein